MSRRSRVARRRRPASSSPSSGPTASGKTDLAVALAERLGGEIVSADSVQIYRGFDVGLGQAHAGRARARAATTSSARSIRSTRSTRRPGRGSRARAIADVRARGRVPIVCGGTFLWVKALLFGLAERSRRQRRPSRERHRAIAEREGRPALHARLRGVDAETAARLHPNDFVRVSRALEVHELTRTSPMSAWQREHGFARPVHRARLMAIACDPAVRSRSASRARARAWLAAGWIEEVEALLAAGYGDARAMASVGYAQVRAALAGEIAASELETAVVRATRVFARRQRTWLNHVDVTWLQR